MKNSFSDWLSSSELGCYLLEREQAYFDRAVADVFGFHAVQLGLPEVDFLRANRIPWQCRVADSGPAQILCDPEQLPFESRSLDLLVMPHVLDFTTVPHQVLREAERVLMPEGRLILTGFNPVSLWGVRRLVQVERRVPLPGGRADHDQVGRRRERPEPFRLVHDQVRPRRCGEGLGPRRCVLPGG